MPQIITASTPLYTAPRPDSGRETDALFGESVEILAEQGDWSEVILATDGYQGWIRTTAMGTAPPPDHYVSAPRVLLTATPDIKSPGAGSLTPNGGADGHMVSTLPMMALVTARPAGQGMMALHAAPGLQGYVPARHLRPLGTYATDWVKVAESLMGTPYRWGGRDSTGLDCSALVQLALAAGGIKAKRNSGDQEKTLGRTLEGDASNRPGLQRGDLVFWGGHVGIMSDAELLLHANMHHAMTAQEPLTDAISRFMGLGLEVRRYARI